MIWGWFVDLLHWLKFHHLSQLKTLGSRRNIFMLHKQAEAS